MNTNIKYILAFATGAAAGAIVTRKLLIKKYEQIIQIIQEEVDSATRKFSDREAELTKNVEDLCKEISNERKPDKKQFEDYKKLTSERGYVDYTAYSTPKAQEKEIVEESADQKPYVITPEEFDEIEGYSLISLTYYADGILADDDDNLVDDVDNVVGVESLNHFGEFEDDAVHVRNDRLRCDYEILRDNRKYKDVIGAVPHKVED